MRPACDSIFFSFQGINNAILVGRKDWVDVIGDYLFSVLPRKKRCVRNQAEQNIGKLALQKNNQMKVAKEKQDRPENRPKKSDKSGPNWPAAGQRSGWLLFNFHDSRPYAFTPNITGFCRRDAPIESSFLHSVGSRYYDIACGFGQRSASSRFGEKATDEIEIPSNGNQAWSCALLPQMS